jgi:hypothetical protein
MVLIMVLLTIDGNLLFITFSEMNVQEKTNEFDIAAKTLSISYTTFKT